jgi:glycosyltransferase involved in cell wall biosynthesis
MSALRVMLVTDAVGGVWVYTHELARALAQIGIQPFIAVMGPSPTRQQRQRVRGIKLIDTGLPLDWMPTSPADMRRAGDSIAAIANLEAVDIVQTCSAALLADSQFDQPTVAVQHSCVATWWAAVRGTALPHEFSWRRDLVEAGLNRANAIVAPTSAFAADTAQMYDLVCPVLAVHNGRRPDTPDSVEQAHFVFIASRLWDEGKNAATLDDAAAHLKVPFQAAGPARGPDGASARFKHLRCIGEISEAEMAGLLATRPIFASAALYEPFGLSVLEAAYAGCALVLSDIPTHRELWAGAAVLVPARDSAGFASAIDSLLRDSGERERRGRLARACAELCTPERMAHAMADIYMRVAARDIGEIPLQLAGAA